MHVLTYCHVQEGLYAWVDESDDELRLVTGTPPSFLHCSRQGQLPGCLFMFDQIDQQCADGRTGEQCSSYCSYLSQTYVLIIIIKNLSVCVYCVCVHTMCVCL